eukprot:CFRG6690T1
MSSVPTSPSRSVSPPEDGISKEKIIITYCNDFNMWKYMETEVKKRLPFRNVQWRSTTGRARVIDELNVHLEPMDNSVMKTTSKPLLHLYIVSCDDHDTYKAIVKQKIQTFADQFEDPANYMIVYVTTQDSTLAKNFKLRGSTFDKIKTDFGKNCTEIRMKVEDSSDVWDQFLNRLLEALMTSFKKRVETCEQSPVLALPITNPEWRLQLFFSAKNLLAFEYYRMMLFEEALLLYDEVENVMNQLDRTNEFRDCHECPWFPANVLDMVDLPCNSFDTTDYWEKIISNQLSVFELRSYLFARQCKALFMLSKPLAGARRAYHYIEQQAKYVTVHETPEMKESFFVNLWSHSVARDLVLKYEQQMDEIDPELMDETEIKQYLIIMADLRDIARKNLDPVGVHLGYLPNTCPFLKGVYGSIEQNVNESVKRRRRDSLTNVSYDFENMKVTDEEENEKAVRLLSKIRVRDSLLIESVKFMTKFDLLYQDLALSAIENYNFVERKRRANLVHRDIAAMLFHRKNYAEAEKHMYNVCEQYVRDGWRTLELDIRSDLAHCQRRCGHYQKYIESCTTLITKACPLPHEEKLFYMEDITALVYIPSSSDHTERLRRGSQRSIGSTNAERNDYEDPDDIINCWFEPLLYPEPPIVPPRGVYMVGDELAISVLVVSNSEFDLTFDSVSLAIQIYGDDEIGEDQNNQEVGRDGFKDLDVSKVPHMFKNTADTMIESDESQATVPVGRNGLSFIAAGVAVPVPEPDENGEIPPLFVTENNVTLKPGENIVSFGLEAPIKGRYECVELIACMGKLQLRHIYDYLDIEYVINVESSLINLSIAPHIPTNSIFLSGILQYITMTVNTNEGDMLDGTLTFMPSDGLVIKAIRDNVGVMYSTPKPGQSSEDVEGIQFDLKLNDENWSIPMPECKLGDRFTFEIAIIVPELCLIEHEIGFDLMYSKSTAEVFKLASVLALQFHNAFSVHTDTALTSDLIKYVKADIQSHLPIPITLTNIDLRPQNPAITLKPSPMNSLVSTKKLHGGQTADLLWDLALDESIFAGEVIDCVMVVSFQLCEEHHRVSASKDLELCFEMQVDVYKPEYKSSILFKGMEESDATDAQLTIGESADAEVLITYTGSNTEDKTVVANVEVNHRHWMVSGNDQCCFSLSKNNPSGRFAIKLIPLSVGHIFIPHVALYTVAASRNKLFVCQAHDRDKGRQITVIHRSRNMPPQFSVVAG